MAPRAQRPKPVKEQVSSVGELAATALERIDDKFIGNEKQTAILNDIVTQFLKSAHGDSYVISGGPRSGRMQLIDSVLEKHERNNKFIVNRLKIGYIGSDTNALSLLELESVDLEARRVVVIRDADELASRQRQALLYNLLNSARNRPWLVFLNVLDAEFVSRLEKRVRSRLSPRRIATAYCGNEADYVPAFKQFVYLDQEPEWNTFVDRLCEVRSVRNELEFLRLHSPSYYTLKRMTAAFLGFLCDCNATLMCEEEALCHAGSLLAEAVHCLQDDKPEFAATIENLRLQSFCLLLCVLRRVRNNALADPTGDYGIPYQKIFQDFQYVANRVDSRVTFSSQLELFKELDELARLGLLEVDTKTNNFSYRTARLAVDRISLDSIVKSTKAPENVMFWYGSMAA